MGDDPVNVLDKFLRRFDSKVTEEMYDAVDALNANIAEKMAANGFTDSEIAAAKLDMHDVIIVASLIEKETAKASESPSIAAVIYNRLCSKLIIRALRSTRRSSMRWMSGRKSSRTRTRASSVRTTRIKMRVCPQGRSRIRASRPSARRSIPRRVMIISMQLGNDGVHHFSRTYYEHQDFLESLNADDTTTDTADETGARRGADRRNRRGRRGGGSDENTQTP